MSTFKELFEGKPKAVNPMKYAGKNTEVFYPVEMGVESGYIAKDTSRVIIVWGEFEGSEEKRSKFLGEKSKKYFTEVYLNFKDAKIARGI